MPYQIKYQYLILIMALSQHIDSISSTINGYKLAVGPFCCLAHRCSILQGRQETNLQLR